jgi:hypothetical protein
MKVRFSGVHFVLPCTVALGLMSASAHALTQASQYSFELRVNADRPTCTEQKALVQQSILNSGEALGKELKDVRVHCLAAFSEGAYLMSVSYQVKGASHVYTAHWGSGNLSFDAGTERGIFSSGQECREAARDEVLAYERLTGLEARFWACTPQERGSGTLLSVTGFGIPKARLQMLEFRDRMFSDSGMTAQEQGFLRGYLASEGAEMRSSQGGRFLYFSPKQVWVNFRTLAVFKDPAHCSEQLADVGEIFNGRPYLASCVDSELRGLFAGYQLVRNDYSVRTPKYSSYEECRSFLPEVKAAARALNPSGFLGGICAPESGGTGRFEASLWAKL